MPKINLISSLMPMKKSEYIAGTIYLPLHIFAMPILLGIFAFVSPGTLTEMQANSIYYLTGLLVILVFMRDFLKRSFDILLDNILRSTMAVLSAYVVEMLLSYIVTIIMILLLGDLENPNNANVVQLAEGNFRAIVILSVITGPIVEEVLFRGVLFGGISRKNRIAAYIISIVLFAVYHLWQYFVTAPDIMILVYALQYVPMGFALAWCYERSGSIWSPIIFHMLSNAISLSLLT